MLRLRDSFGAGNQDDGGVLASLLGLGMRMVQQLRIMRVAVLCRVAAVQQLQARLRALNETHASTHLLPDGARIAHEAVRGIHVGLAQKAQVALGACLDALLPLGLRHACHVVLVRHLRAGSIAQAAEVRVQPLEREQELRRASDATSAAESALTASPQEGLSHTCAAAFPNAPGEHGQCRPRSNASSAT